MNNVLVLSAGRRVELVRALKKELKMACPTAATFALILSGYPQPVILPTISQKAKSIGSRISRLLIQLLHDE